MDVETKGREDVLRYLAVRTFELMHKIMFRGKEKNKFTWKRKQGGITALLKKEYCEYCEGIVEICDDIISRVQAISKYYKRELNDEKE